MKQYLALVAAVFAITISMIVIVQSIAGRNKRRQFLLECTGQASVESCKRRWNESNE